MRGYRVVPLTGRLVAAVEDFFFFLCFIVCGDSCMVCCSLYIVWPQFVRVEIGGLSLQRAPCFLTHP